MKSLIKIMRFLFKTTKPTKMDSTPIPRYQFTASDHPRGSEVIPTNAEHYLRRGIWRKENNDIWGCIRDFSKLIELTPYKSITKESAYILRGLAYFEGLTSYDSAAEDFTSALELNPDLNERLQCYYYRGQSRYNSLEYKGAAEDFTYVIDLDSKRYTSVYYARAKVRYHLEDEVGVIEDCNLALQLNPHDADVYSLRGHAKDLLDDHTGAIADLDKAIEINPNHGEAYLGRGMCKIDYLDQKESGLTDLRRSVKLGSPGAVEILLMYTPR
jgi:tetratricopeptide (TPR) repeat protein